ncbi:hypothetical protein F4804DRAFT_350408 [Jackrogersella minutella]|nr:hypothetical protein F4804DRAFT_350408 [Jackrogersella minutella]
MSPIRTLPLLPPTPGPPQTEEIPTDHSTAPPKADLLHIGVQRSDGGDGGLTPSAAAGIGVGSTLGGIILLALVAFLVYRGRRGRAKLRGRKEAGARELGKQGWGEV